MGHERSNLEDQVLVMDAQDGHPEAMSRLIKRWQKRLWHHAYRLTGDSEAAWDITQSAWYDIIRRLQKLHDPACFPTWAYRITTCKAVDWIKAKRRHKTVSVESIETLPVGQPQETDINDLLEQLDIDQRVILSLYYFEELCISEISEALRIPSGTVKSRLYSARKAFKQVWENRVNERNKS